MIREVTFPVPKEAWVESGNKLLRTHHFALANRTKKQHKLVASVLGSTFPPVPLHLANGIKNRMVVTLTRICTGSLDSHDNLRTAFKSIVDAIAQWIFRGDHMGRDDDNPMVEWRFQQQQGPAKYKAITIRIEDLYEGRDVRAIKGEPPAVLSAPAAQRPARAARAATAAAQTAIKFKRAWLALPWRQEPGEEGYDVVEATSLSEMLEAPPVIDVIDPRTRRRVSLYRYAHRDPDLGGDVWLYTPVRPVAAPAQQPGR